MFGLLSILHLEDNSLDAELVCACLEVGGIECELHQTASGKEFRRMIGSSEFDLILSDSSIAGLSGRDALELASRLAPNTPFIFVSGSCTDEATMEGLNPGASDYVTKNHLLRLPAAVRRSVLEAQSKKHLAGLFATAEFQADLLSGLSEAVFAIDADRRIRFWNEAASTLFESKGMSPDGMDVVEADALCGCRFFQEILQRELQPGESHELFCEFDSQPGKWILIKHSKSIESGGFGCLDLFAAVDVSSIKRLEARSNELESRFEQHVNDRTSDLSLKNDELRSFSYSVSHDLQAPLHVILGYSQALSDDHAAALGVEGLDYLKRIEVAGARMNQLITGLLHLAVLERDQLACDRVDLTVLAQNIASEFIAASCRANIQVKVEPGLQTMADPRLMRSLLENLIGNAVKFAPKSRLTTIEFGRGERDGAEAYFVRDDGDGFCPDDAEAMFEPFKRLNVRGSTWGHGIGLATCRRIVEKHGGRITAHSRLGEGATFTFSIPQSERDAFSARTRPA